MKNKYDAVIIGAGIGGLVCGCLLARMGLKVLISEKTSKPGGYCTSFEAKGHKFDAFVHAFGNLSKGSQFYNILQMLGLLETIDFVRYDPSDAIITPDLQVTYWNNIDKTIDNFKKIFPGETKAIDCFLNLINTDKLDLVYKTRNKTFRTILDEIFQDNKLKAVLSLVILGNLGVPANHINAFTAIKHYKQFMIDGGYYPRLGAQSVSDSLAEKFREMGGELVLSDGVIKIITKNKTAEGIELNSGRIINAEVVISDCDARITFFNLIERNELDERIVQKINSMTPSLSLFIIYLGYEGWNNRMPQDGVNTWVMFNYSFEKIHAEKINYDSEDIDWIMLWPNAIKRQCLVFAQAPFKNPNYWKENKREYMLKVLNKAKKVFPRLLESSNFLNASDPATLNRWTMNYNGAGFGWAATPAQFMDADLARDKVVKNLFLCGHWSTVAQGVEGVAIVGEKVARTILTRLKHA